MTGTYLTTDRAIAELTEYDSSNTNDVAFVTDKVDLSNRQVENDLFDDFDSFPTDSTTKTWKSFSDAALYYFQMLWYKKIGNKDQSDLAKILYSDEKQTLKLLAKSQPTVNTRTKQTSVSASYSSSLLVDIPGMTDSNGNLI